MDSKLSLRRQIENEVVFRQTNERVQKGMDAVQELAVEEGHVPLPQEDDLLLHFYCECSDENCRERIAIKLSLYNEIHTNRKHFLLKPGHEVPLIESIVQKDANYTVVRKHRTPPETAHKLHPTSVENV